jgi:hypothetical protein
MTSVVVDDSSLVVISGTRVRDRFCNEVHTLRRPNRAESDALLVYDCAVRDLDSRELALVLVTMHVAAILGRLVSGLERVSD